MNLNIINLLKQENPDKSVFMDKIDSKLTMNVNRNEIMDETQWLDEIEYTVPHIQKALEKPNKYIVTEEEIVKIELIKKVTVDSIKHLAKHVDLVDEFDEKTQDVKPTKLLNAYKEENYVTYENRFLYTLIKLIEDMIYLKAEKADDQEYKGKNEQKALYEGSTSVKNKKVKMKVEYSVKSMRSQKKDKQIALRIKDLRNNITMFKNTELYQLLDSKKVTLVTSPLKMTNVLLKNVHFQYAVRLWNYLNSHLDIENDIANASNNYEEKGILKDLADEDFFVNYLIYNAVENQANTKNSKAVLVSKKEKDEIVRKLIDEILQINPDILEKDLKKMLAEQYILFKKKKELTLRPLEEAFKKSINKYMDKVQKIKLKG